MRMTIIKNILNWFHKYNEAIETHCRELCLQRDRDRQEYHTWKEIIK